ncbi:manganese transporter [Nitrosopumilus sp. b1]|uniref:metal ABC transporter solute-binding protein, Zn/Mn family n=1 Tax=Nitrosopumilus sp. b1 TaxID=2109907 RepID=UPI0015F5C925|nr:zinc ABC transporter substrate-binding protein [Nitrosopumilus sp. b1]KAF6242012.1 manganese transporter [Nitrosopumilus sp. b1]
MKKPIVIGIVAIAAIIIGISSAVFVQNNDADEMLLSNENSVDNSEKIMVTTTTNVVTDLVENIGGDRVLVTGLMGPGVDPHLYRPSASDVKKLQDADIVFYNGLDLEGKMGDVFVKIGREGTAVWAVSENIPNNSLLSLDNAGHFDPHIWWDATLWMEAAKVVATGLSEYDPENSEFYESNLEAYLIQLEDLNQDSLETMSSIPKEQRVLVTAHDAFQYFGHAYGLEEMAIQGWSTDSEAGIREIQNLADEITQRKIKAIFVETSISPATIEALKAAVQDKGHDVVIGGELFSDAIGEKGTSEGTYIGAFTQNVETIVNALK